MEINLPDGSLKILDDGSNGLDLAKSIGAGLAKSAVALNVNGEQRDLLDELPNNCSVSIITIQSEEGLEIMRHTLTAQVLAKGRRGATGRVRRRARVRPRARGGDASARAVRARRERARAPHLGAPRLVSALRGQRRGL